MKAVAEELYNILLDMDCADYEESKAAEMENLQNDLELLKTHGNGTLLNVIEMLMENY